MEFIQIYFVEFCLAHLINQIKNKNIELFEGYYLKCDILRYFIKYYTDISYLGGVFAKNTSRETNNFPSRLFFGTVSTVYHPQGEFAQIYIVR